MYTNEGKINGNRLEFYFKNFFSAGKCFLFCAFAGLCLHERGLNKVEWVLMNEATDGFVSSPSLDSPHPSPAPYTLFIILIYSRSREFFMLVWVAAGPWEEKKFQGFSYKMKY